MNKIKSLEDLKKIREEALKKRDAKAHSSKNEIIVGMGTVGIASGARETLKSILDFIESNNVQDIIVRQTGNIGLDSFEPIVQVRKGNKETVSYGNVSAEMAREIMESHILKGVAVEKYIIDNK